MRTETEIRQMLAILRAFNSGGNHDLEITALSWVIGEYPLKEESEAEAASKPKPTA
jgi:hypothetical protein